jgi:hypothetical protein
MSVANAVKEFDITKELCLTLNQIQKFSGFSDPYYHRIKITLSLIQSRVLSDIILL